ncbi:hypothetical protein C2G38_2157644 [Gigaspora rosea]|uniref:Uncharacterized protein n=1 Tax=Gigaspora rosea TaxID=44941 RepID=A0A397W8B2_9GLOM|nr:hypothetical protein C2G38_2157644 [Gigaspora rosea]
MIESEYLESAKGSNYWSHLKSDKNTCGDSAGQNNNELWSAQQLYQAPYYLQNLHPFSYYLGKLFIDDNFTQFIQLKFLFAFRETPKEIDEYIPAIQYIETQQSTYETNLEAVEDNSIKEDITQIENLDTAILDTEQEKQEGNTSVTIQMKSDDNIAEKMGMRTKVLH